MLKACLRIVWRRIPDLNFGIEAKFLGTLRLGLRQLADAFSVDGGSGQLAGALVLQLQSVG
jgi:hypothetical protein